MKIRVDESANYKAVFFNHKTVRMRLRQESPITAPLYPEIEDCAINSKCEANCNYCYTSALKTGKNFEDIVEKAEKVWGSLDPGQRPFQIAIGGAGESTLHPDWIPFVKKVNELGIVPNYTTNGMHLSDEILEATEKYCGGVAVSYHPHIKKVFSKAIEKLSSIDTILNVHVILGDKKSFDDLKEIFEKYKKVIKYFVVLPYQAAGRAKESKIDVEDTWSEMFDWVSTLDPNQQKQFAFGALFYEWLKDRDIKLDMCIYEPEIYSGYRLMDDSHMTLRKSSYDLTEKLV